MKYHSIGMPKPEKKHPTIGISATEIIIFIVIVIIIYLLLR